MWPIWNWDLQLFPFYIRQKHSQHYQKPENPQVCYIYFQNNLNGGTQKLLTEISGANQGIHKNFSSNIRNLSFREVYTSARSLETRKYRVFIERRI